MIAGPFHAYLSVHFTCGNASLFVIFVCNCPWGPHVVAAIWPCNLPVYIDVCVRVDSVGNLLFQLWFFSYSFSYTYDLPVTVSVIFLFSVTVIITIYLTIFFHSYFVVSVTVTVNLNNTACGFSTSIHQRLSDCRRDVSGDR